MPENRLDLEMTERGLCKSREHAKQLIKSHKVTVDGRVCEKPSRTVTDETEIAVTGDVHRYVGRGGLKLEKAVDLFKINLNGKVCLDIGASTGGFTDCMLQNGASLVYALDVGHSQLDEKLIHDSRVINMEKTNIRETSTETFNKKIDFIATDVSFISLKLVLPKINELLSDSGRAVVLIKPQFEAGKSNLSKTGIVRDRRVHRQILSDITDFAANLGFTVSGVCVSPVRGGSGNSEYLMYLSNKKDISDKVYYDIDELVNEALRKEIK